MQALAILVVAAVTVAFTFTLRRNLWRRGRLPPGPPGLPLLGNLFDIPLENQWLLYTQWIKVYGDIISLQVLGYTIIILNSARDVRERVLVKRGMQYAERMPFIMLQHAGWEDNMETLSPERFRTVKRFLTTSLGPSALTRFVDAEDHNVTASIKRMLTCSSAIDPEKHLRRMVGSITLKILYGYDVQSDDDELLEISEQALRIGLDLTAPGWLIDTFPWMRYLPGWMFGPGFVRIVRRSRELSKAARSVPIEWTKSQMAAGKAQQSLARDILSMPVTGDTKMLFAVLTDVFAASIDTVVSTSLTLFLALALFPDVQVKAQREVDDLTHAQRLPTYDDRSRLPYVSALVKELYRFRGVVNLGFPHSASQGAEYKGYTIPNKAVIFANIWWIFHNPDKYPDPFVFNPDRFLGDNTNTDMNDEVINEDPTHYVFGFGPRQCPGRHIAESTMFLLVAKVLAACDISSAVDESGASVLPSSVGYAGSFVTRPLPYKCSIKPRANVFTLLRDTLED